MLSRRRLRRTLRVPLSEVGGDGSYHGDLLVTHFGLGRARGNEKIRVKILQGDRDAKFNPDCRFFPHWAWGVLADTGANRREHGGGSIIRFGESGEAKPRLASIEVE